MPEIRRHCCFIGGWRNRRCNSDADWQIWNKVAGADPYDYVDACRTHVGDLLMLYKVADVEWLHPD